MKRKSGIVILGIILIILIILLFNQKNVTHSTYHCVVKTDATTKSEIDYLVYYKDDKVIKHEITKTHKAFDTASRENVATLKWLFQQENMQYSEYEGVTIKELKDYANVYSFKYIIDVQKISDDNISFFETFRTVKEQKEYLNGIENIKCE